MSVHTKESSHFNAKFSFYLDGGGRLSIRRQKKSPEEGKKWKIQKFTETNFLLNFSVFYELTISVYCL